jgi:cyclophilin family peptidyl-prolyl cis-trans isomerase/HEAT repeat protein
MKRLLFVFLFFSQTIFAQHDEIRDILYHQDQRLLSDGKLFQYLLNPNPDISSAAAIALANIQDSSAIDPLITLLNNNQNRLSCEAAFALGQIGPNKKSETALLEKIANCNNDSLKIKLFEALGKTGGENSLNKIIEIPENTEDLLYEKILSVSRYGIRKIRTEKSVKFLIEQIKNNNKINSIISYALWRTGDKKLLNPYQEQIIQLLGNSDFYTQMWAANSLGVLDINEKYFKPLLDCLKNNDWKVQVNAIKVLEKYPIPVNNLDFILGKTNDINPHISLAAIRFLKNIKLKPDLSHSKIINKLISITENAGNKYSWLEQGEAAISLSNQVLNDDDGYKFIAPLLKTQNYRLKSKAITALGNLRTERILNLLIDSIPDKNPLISISRIESITKLFKKNSSNKIILNKIGTLFTQMLNDRDMAVVTTIATASADSVFKNIIPPDVFIKTFRSMKVPDDVEALVEIINTLGNYQDDKVIRFLEETLNNEDKTVVTAAVNALNKLTNNNYNKFIPSNSKALYSDYDWKYLESIFVNPFLTLETERGTIKIRLFPENAPFTSISTCRLVEKKFFDNLVFHRVVPNFVIQGGDPRGDGWGGPGYSIRTEISSLRYNRGSVGVASAGKDTEGCQFFITHSPQPHLDGRYTIFGEVIEGMDIADKIQEGDKILRVFR